MAAKRIDYKTAMRSAIDARHQPSNVLAPGKPGSARHVSGAGIEHPQNKVVAGAAGQGTDGASAGPKGGPSPHPQNLVHATNAGRGTDAASSGSHGGPSPIAQGPNVPAGGSSAEEAGESVQYEAQEQAGGAEHGEIDNTVAGPRAVGKPGEPIPHAGQGNDAHGVGFKAAPGGPVTHPQNLVGASRAGQGTDVKSSGPKGGNSPNPLNRVLPVAKARKSAKRPAAPKSGTSNLHVLSKI